jgi:hypothetical protein
MILRAALDTVARLAEVVRDADKDAPFGRRKRLLIDLRLALHGLNYEDTRSQTEKLANMPMIVAPRWALLIMNNISAAATARLFTMFARREGVSAEAFTDEDEALRWLRQERSELR